MHDYNDNFNNAIEYAVKKTKLTWWKLILLGMMGCIYVGIAYISFVLIITGMQEPGTFLPGWQDKLALGTAPAINMGGWPLIIAAALFPVGLLLIIFLGGSLFTSDNLTSIAIMTKRVKIPPVILKWFLTLLGNLIGAFIIAGLARGANVFGDKQLFILQQIIAKKVHLEWWQAFISGILCNILVAGTVWSTMATKHSIAKIFLIYFPIWLFAIVGFQHVTANSILFAFGWAHADNPIMQNIGQGIFNVPISLADWSFRSVFINMIPAMIGNWLSGAIFLPFTYFWLSDNHKKLKELKKNNSEPIEKQTLYKSEIPNFEEFYDIEDDLHPADNIVQSSETSNEEFYDNEEFADN
ncbi:MAG: formate/nitrite transporter family protein, partial [Mycoplasmataceae bacterium]|nr:formate/nitrite transporter family protein [Mycoplasmataceae bacterium]